MHEVVPRPPKSRHRTHQIIRDGHLQGVTRELDVTIPGVVESCVLKIYDLSVFLWDQGCQVVHILSYSLICS